MTAASVLRARLLSSMKRLRDEGVPYCEPASLPSCPGERPTSLDCSTTIDFVCREVFGMPEWLNRFGTAGWSPSAWGLFHQDLTEDPIASPDPGDLAFYSKPNPGNLRDPLWHVMMVTKDGGVVGACNEAGKVEEYPLADYSKVWCLRGYKRFPLEARAC